MVGLKIKIASSYKSKATEKEDENSINPLKPDVWESSVGPRGGPQGPPYKVNEGVVLDPKMLFRGWASIEM